MLQYTLRVRDLVHGTILFTALEQKIINHPLFQRLRQIRQNDVAFYVYPSLNTSRFEHVLGTCRVAGMMAENLTKSPKWRTYARELKAQTGVASKEEFVELARLYALLHDIGHLPLSHLFEMAVGSSQEVAKEWTNVQGFSKLHEAFGAVIVRRLIEDIVFPEDIKRALLCLMTEKSFSLENPLSVVKALIDAEIDADRIDFVRRDGLLAGGEYGNYDIRRLCDCVFIERDERGWLVAYSESAITSMEALLLDRYRTHVWIHFHHQVVAMKMLVRHLINKACEAGAISKKHFSIARIEEFAMRDDVWLWNVLRGMEACDELTHMIQRAVFFREKSNVVNLWKNRPAYHELREKVMRKARTTDLYFGMIPLYERCLTDNLDIDTFIFEVRFSPISKDAVLLYSERDKKLTGKNLLDISRLVADLDAIWKSEPQEFILLVGHNVAKQLDSMKRQWIDLTARWIKE